MAGQKASGYRRVFTENHFSMLEALKRSFKSLSSMCWVLLKKRGKYARKWHH